MTRLASSLLIAANALALAAASALACHLPAWRAASADPVAALRTE